MISIILFFWIGIKLNAPAWYYILIVWRLSVEVINAYKDGKVRQKVNRLWVYRDTPDASLRVKKLMMRNNAEQVEKSR